MEELIKRLERVIATGAPDKDGLHPISAETVLEVVRGLSEHGTNLAEVGTDAVSRKAVKELAYSQIRSMYCGVALKEQRETMLRIADNVIGLLAPVASKQLDIVRCKDCKHWIPYDWMFSEVWQSKNIADYPEDDIGCDCSDMAMKANDFCSRGEKREVTT